MAFMSRLVMEAGRARSFALIMRMAGTAAPLRPEAAGGEDGADMGVVSRWGMHPGGACWPHSTSRPRPLENQ